MRTTSHLADFMLSFGLINSFLLVSCDIFSFKKNAYCPHFTGATHLITNSESAWYFQILLCNQEALVLNDTEAMFESLFK